MAWQVSSLGTPYPAWTRRLLRTIADAATQTWPARGATSLRGREADHLDLRLRTRPDRVKPHPETGWDPIALSDKSNKHCDPHLLSLGRITRLKLQCTAQRPEAFDKQMGGTCTRRLLMAMVS